MLSAADIKKFQQIYLDEFGVSISAEEAAEQGMKLLTLMSDIYKPMTQEEYDKTLQARSATLMALSE